MSSSGNRRQMDVTKLMMNYKVELINDEMNPFYVDFHGPKDSLYQGGLWKVLVELPPMPPTIIFTNKIYHPNIHKERGEICLNAMGEAWSPMYDLVNAFEVFLPQLLLYPNPSDPFHDAAAALMIGDLPDYEQTGKEYCEKYAKPEDEAVSSDEKSTDKEPSEAESHSSDETVVAKPDL